MPDYFFFSYARANLDDYLRQFYEDLSDKIREKVGLGKEAQVGFFDQQDIELGTEWDKKLAQELQECRVMVSAYSPAYFNSRYCGKEWECFRRRRALDPALPPVIKPIIWIPQMDGENPPEAVSHIQYYRGDPAAAHNAVGLKTMRKQYARFEEGYEAFIEQLAAEILRAYKSVNLPALNPFPELNEVVSAFHPPAPAPAPAAPANTQPGPATPAVRRRGPKFARFVIIAGDPNEFPAGVRRRDFYLECGGVEWKPYYPDVKPIMSVAQEVAGNMNIISEELPFSADLADEVSAAEDARSLVVLFVDSWTAELPSYRAGLAEIDKKNYLNCSIFVPWNKDDPETAVRCDQLMNFVREDVFPRWSRFADLDLPIFRDKIYNIDQLRDQLRDTLLRLQSSLAKSVIERTSKENIPRRIESNILKPILSHEPAPGGGTL